MDNSTDYFSRFRNTNNSNQIVLQIRLKSETLLHITLHIRIKYNTSDSVYGVSLFKDN